MIMIIHKYIEQCYHCDGQSCLRTSQVNKTTACTAEDSCVTLFDGCKLY